MFALTVKNGHTRIYLTDGTANGGGIAGRAGVELLAHRQRQPAGGDAARLAGARERRRPIAATHTFPATYTGWQNLTSKTTANPYFATDDFCTGQCWYDEDVYTPAGMPDTVYVIGSNQYGEQPCNTKGVGCGNGRSNGREVLYSNTAGDPDGCAHGPAHVHRPVVRRTGQPPRRGARTRRTSTTGCVRAPNGIHPDQHEIVVNPGNPTQIFEGSDGGMIRTSGDVRRHLVPVRRARSATAGPAAADVGQLRRLQAAAVAGADGARPHRQEAEQHAAVHQRGDQPVATPARSWAARRTTARGRTTTAADRDTFNQVIYGDGGNAGYDATNPTWRFNEFTGGFSDSNFRNGDPERG